MLDINLFLEEKGGNPELIRESQRARFASVEIVDEIISDYKEWTKIKFQLDESNKEINKLQKQIGLSFKNKTDCTDLLKQKDELNEKKKSIIEKEQQADLALKQKINLLWIPESLPQDQELTNIASATKAEAKLSHHEVLLRLDGYDPERGVKISGHRGYFLRTYGVFLNQALINYGLSFLYSKGYIPLQAPVMMNKDQMAKTAQLSQFDEELYKVMDGDDEKYLIATSEQPISAYHAEEKLVLMVRMLGVFSESINLKRLNNLLSLILNPPWDEFERMIANSEEFYQSLGLPYRVVGIVSGELNNAAAKKYDLEAWFPYQKEFKELVSCSNCTDYQSRNLEIRSGIKKKDDNEKKYVHCLNSTLSATERALCCILENYQTEDGLKIPEVLRKYIPGEPEFIPYVNELPKNSTSNKKK
ncbi:unnamed protein product [Hanseniaspora opuntiae]